MEEGDEKHENCRGRGRHKTAFGGKGMQFFGKGLGKIDIAMPKMPTNLPVPEILVLKQVRKSFYQKFKFAISQ